MMLNKELADIRCPHCRRMLARANIGEGVLELYCRRCGHTTTFSYIKASTVPLTAMLNEYGEAVPVGAST